MIISNGENSDENQTKEGCDFAQNKYFTGNLMLVS